MKSGKYEEQKKKAALSCAKALIAAAVATEKYRTACANAGEDCHRLDDTRVTLPEKMYEYGNYLNSVFDK